MLIDIFHDTACPWCRIGKKNLFDALALAGKREKVNIRWHPFILDSSIPADGCNFTSFMEKRKGLSPQQLQNLFDYAKQAGLAVGVKLNFEQINLAVNTKLSHQLINLAPEEIKQDVVEEIYKAYFEAGLNIGNSEQLLAIAKSCGMDTSNLLWQLNDPVALDAIEAQSIFARLNGINSVPFFMIDNKVKVDGSHSVEVFLHAINEGRGKKEEERSFQ